MSPAPFAPTRAIKLFAVPVILTPTVRPAPARMLFERCKDLRGYDVPPDGRHFSVAEETESSPNHSPIVVIPDWFEELKAKVPVPP
jgi:hypothetical protein